MSKEITIKHVYDNEGAFSHIELWQGASCIEVSLGDTTLNSKKSTYKWDTLRDQIDTMQERIQKEAAASIGSPLIDAYSLRLMGKKGD